MMAVADLTKSAFLPFLIKFFEQPAGPEWPPDPGGQCGKRHATVASLIISTGNDHSTTQGECRDDIHHCDIHVLVYA